MRTMFMFLFPKSPFEHLKRHAEKVKECAWMFKKAFGCYLSVECQEFEDLKDKVAKLESEADKVKREIRESLPKGILLPVDKFQLFQYIREQDKVLDEVEEVLYWLSYRREAIPEQLRDEYIFFVDLVIPPIEKLATLVQMALEYFKSHSDEKKDKIESLIRDIKQKEKEADFVERELKYKVFSLEGEALSVFYLIRLTELIGSIADHAENAADIMRAMIAK